MVFKTTLRYLNVKCVEKNQFSDSWPKCLNLGAGSSLLILSCVSPFSQSISLPYDFHEWCQVQLQGLTFSWGFWPKVQHDSAFLEFLSTSSCKRNSRFTNIKVECVNTDKSLSIMLEAGENRKWKVVSRKWIRGFKQMGRGTLMFHHSIWFLTMTCVHFMKNGNCFCKCNNKYFRCDFAVLLTISAILTFM